MSLFRHPEYIHVLLNHFPLTGLVVALLALGGAIFCRNAGAMRLGLGLVGLMAFSAWPVSEFGEKGYDRVYSLADDDGQASLKKHAELAHRWVPCYYLLAGLSWLGLAMSWKWPKSLMPLSVIVLIGGLICLSLGLKIAQEGGEIRHDEFRAQIFSPEIYYSNKSACVPVQVIVSYHF